MRVFNNISTPIETTLMVREYCGNHIYRDGVLERINNDYGYWAGGNWYYHVKDYQGNVRAVTDGQGALEEVNNYYPYCALMGGGTLGGNQGVQPYKYGAKELDRQNGLDWYDSRARMYDPVLGRTPTMDPLAEKYYSISPYAWCSGNPILFVDPTGMNPVYKLDGNYVGMTNEGLTGDVLIFAGTSKVDFSTMTSQEAMENLGAMSMDDYDELNLLTDKAKTRIITNLISHFDGEKVFEKTFSMKSIENESIEIQYSENNSNWNTTYHTIKTIPMRITGTGTSRSSYETTVENLAASIIYHEWYGHGMWNLGDDTNNHSKAYYCVMVSPLWDKTTQKYKEFIKKMYNDYQQKERKRN